MMNELQLQKILRGNAVFCGYLCDYLNHKIHDVVQELATCEHDVNKVMALKGQLACLFDVCHALKIDDKQEQKYE